MKLVKTPSYAPRTPDDVYLDDDVKVTFRLGPGRQSVRPVEMTAAKFQVAVRVAGNGAGIVYGD